MLHIGRAVKHAFFIRRDFFHAKLAMFMKELMKLIAFEVFCSTLHLLGKTVCPISYHIVK